MHDPLLGTFHPEDDFPVLERPSDQPTFGENHAFWFFDDGNRVHSYNHLTTLDELFTYRRERNWLLLPDGTDDPRVLVSWSEGGQTTAKGPGGANLVFQCIEPFRRWRVEYTGTMRDMTSSELTRGRLREGRRVLVRYTVDADMAVPPWQQGTLSAAARDAFDRDAGRFIGGLRYEQLFRMTGRLKIFDDEGLELEFTGSGMRTHRRGERQLTRWHGHSWQTALFPSGRAFGLMRFPDAEGSQTMQYDEAFIFDHGRMLTATVLESAWLSSYQGVGERFRIRLHSDELGEQVIDGEVLGQSWRTMVLSDVEEHEYRHGVSGEAGTYVLAQGAARYRWNDESATGQIERSTAFSAMRPRLSELKKGDEG